MNIPQITVIMATYNHENYVADAIRSVLKQEKVEFEFLISDDGSTDRTQSAVESEALKDPRIKFFPNNKNRGACIVTNELIDRASGEFIALINSDDYWLGNNKLYNQLKVMHANPNIGACFGKARFVDSSGKPIPKSSMPSGSVFDQTNKSKGKWLRHFFEKGNAICHPTMLIRKKCYQELGCYDNRFRQLPDFDMWIRLVKKYDIHISPDELIAFRHLPGKNASSPTHENMRRLLTEFYFILSNFFESIDQNDFYEGFGDILIQKQKQTIEHMEIEQSFLFLKKDKWSHHIYNQVGIEQIFKNLNSKQHKEILNGTYNFNERSFHNLLSEYCAFDIENPSSQINKMPSDILIKNITERAIRKIPAPIRTLLRI